MSSYKNDPRRPGEAAEDAKRAATYGEPGSLKNAMLRLGFMPDSDEVAFGILKGIVEENEALRRRVEGLNRGIDWNGID